MMIRHADEKRKNFWMKKRLDPEITAFLDYGIRDYVERMRAAGDEWKWIRDQVGVLVENNIRYCEEQEAKEVTVRRIPFGREPDSRYHEGDTCSCGAPFGEYHFRYCTEEICPICGGQLISGDDASNLCDCPEEYKMIPETPEFPKKANGADGPGLTLVKG